MLTNHPKLKNFFTIIGMLSSVLFTIILILGFLLFINIKNLKESFGSSNNQTNTQNLDKDINNGFDVGEFNPNILVNNLSPEHKKILDNLGIDSTNLPTKITKEQETCALEAIGAKRLNEIISGATPTFSELIKAKSCI